MAPRAIASLAVLVALALNAPSASALVDQPQTQAAKGPERLIVQWAAGAAPAEKAAAREDAEVSFATNLGSPLFQLVEVDRGQAPAVAVAELEDDPAVVLAERDGYRSTDAVPNDPLFSQLWGLKNGGAGVEGFLGAVAGADIDAEGAWIRTLGDPGVVVADIDSGYQFEHPDLAGVVWTNPDEIANGSDDDANGYVDDLHGYDFVGANAEAIAADADPSDDDLLSGGHGVHTAGTIAAAGDDGIGVVGVAPQVRLMPLRVCSRLPSAAANRCPFSAIVNAINYAGKEGARVANMSLGGTVKSQAEVNALAANPGTLFVISAGNDGQDNETTPHYPCNFDPAVDAAPAVPGAIDNVLCVAATDQADGLASFSDWGASSVDLGAPGTETLSTYPLSEPFLERFTVDNFAVKWPATAPDGGFARTNESPPLSSFGVTDVVGAPTPETVRETTSQAFTLPPNAGCVLLQNRHVELAGGDQFRYSVLLDGAEEVAATGAKSTVPWLELRSLNLPAEFKAGGQVQLRLRFTAGAAATADSGVWLDDLRLRCRIPTYKFLEGTSMAAPQVSGAAALLFSQQPGASVSDVKTAILDSVDPTPSLSGKTVSGGRLNASAAADRFDEVAPDAPTLSIEPDSPANENEPTLLGSAEERSSVELFSGPDCEAENLLETIPAAQLADPGYTATVPDNSVSEFSARAIDTAVTPNVSDCSATVTYAEESPPDEEAPDAPALTSTSPASPANVLSPRLLGAAEAGSTVRIYAGTECADAPVATGSAAELASPGIEVTVAAETTAEFSATATDPALNVSECSAPISYTHTATIVKPPVVIVDPPPIGPPPPPPTCKVPKLAGKTLAQAKTALRRAGCAFGKATKPKPRKGQPAPRLVVKSSTPRAGTATAGKVNLKLGPKPKAK